MRVVYRIHNFKTFPLFREKKISEYSTKTKKELFSLITNHKKRKENLHRLMQMNPYKHEVEATSDSMIWGDVMDSIIKEALRNKITGINTVD